MKIYRERRSLRGYWRELLLVLLVFEGMSCQVMYQSHHPYFPYHRTPAAQEPTKESLVDGARSNSPYSSYPSSQYQSVTNLSSPENASTAAVAASTNASAPALPPLTRGGQAGLKAVKGEKESGEDSFSWNGRDGGDEEGHRSAHYLSANCVIFTYYTGDVSKELENHFTASLSPASRDPLPLSARNLPPSFWDSSWVSPSLPREEAYQDPYSGDPWQQYMAAQMAVGGGYSPHMYSHRSYSSLLLQSRPREWGEGGPAGYWGDSVAAAHHPATHMANHKDWAWF